MTEQELREWFQEFEQLMAEKLDAIPMGTQEVNLRGDLSRFQRIHSGANGAKAEKSFGLVTGSLDNGAMSELDRMRAYHDAVQAGELFVVGADVKDEKSIAEHTYQIYMENGKAVVSAQPVSKLPTEQKLPPNEPNWWMKLIHDTFGLNFYQEEFDNYERAMREYRQETPKYTTRTAIKTSFILNKNINSEKPLSVPELADDEARREICHLHAVEEKLRAVERAANAETAQRVDRNLRINASLNFNTLGLEETRKMFLGAEPLSTYSSPFITTRGYPTSTCICRMLVKGYSLTDIMNPEKLQNERLEAGKWYREVIANKDVASLSATIYDGMQELMKETARLGENRGLVDRQKIEENITSIFLIGNMCQDINQISDSCFMEYLAHAEKKAPGHGAEDAIHQKDVTTSVALYFCDLSRGVLARTQLVDGSTKNTLFDASEKSIFTGEFVRDQMGKLVDSQPDKPFLDVIPIDYSEQYGGCGASMLDTEAGQRLLAEMESPEKRMALVKQAEDGSLFKSAKISTTQMEFFQGPSTYIVQRDNAGQFITAQKVVTDVKPMQNELALENYELKPLVALTKSSYKSVSGLEQAVSQDNIGIKVQVNSAPRTESQVRTISKEMAQKKAEVRREMRQRSGSVGNPTLPHVQQKAADKPQATANKGPAQKQ